MEGAIYLISCRGLDGEMVFKDKADTNMYLELINRYKGKHSFRLYAYTLLPERLHLVVEPVEDATVSQIMHDLNSLYTKYFNGKYSRHGHLFESRFKSVLVEKAKYLVESTRHVHRQMPDHAVSSLDIYAAQEEGRETAALPVGMTDEIAEVLRVFKDKGASSSYKLFCSSPLVEESAEIEKLFRRSTVIGSAEFVEKVQNRVQEHAQLRKEQGQVLSRRARITLYVLGAFVLIATASSIYLYVSRKQMEAQYESVVRQLEGQATQQILSAERPPQDKPASGGAS